MRSSRSSAAIPALAVLASHSACLRHRDRQGYRRPAAREHYRPEAGTDGPSWLSSIGHMKDSLWSIDLFRCESILLRSHWIMVVMGVFTRRIIGFAVERADLCGISVCRMFSQVIVGHSTPRHLSSDHDPLFRYDPRLLGLCGLTSARRPSAPATRRNCASTQFVSSGSIITSTWGRWAGSAPPGYAGPRLTLLV
jgi:hypothetical protein